MTYKQFLRLEEIFHRVSFPFDLSLSVWGQEAEGQKIQKGTQGGDDQSSWKKKKEGEERRRKKRKKKKRKRKRRKEKKDPKKGKK